MRYLVIVIMGALLFGCQTGPSEARPELIEWLTDLNAAQTIALQQSKPIMIDFYTSWCGWCKKLDEDTYADKKVAEVAKDFVCVKIDGDKNQALTKEYRVQGYPTIAFLKPDGTLIDSIPGYQPPEQFLELLKEMKVKAGQ